MNMKKIVNSYGRYNQNISVDYSNLIGCADYKIPQTLSIIEYNNELSRIVDQKIQLENYC